MDGLIMFTIAAIVWFSLFMTGEGKQMENQKPLHHYQIREGGN